MTCISTISNEKYDYQFETFENQENLIQRNKHYRERNLQLLYDIINTINTISYLPIDINLHKKNNTEIPIAIAKEMTRHVPLKLLNVELLTKNIQLTLNQYVETKQKITPCETRLHKVNLVNSINEFVFTKSTKTRCYAKYKKCYSITIFRWAIYNLFVEGPKTRRAIDVTKLLNEYRPSVKLTKSNLKSAQRNVITDPIQEKFLPEVPMSDELRLQMINIANRYFNETVTNVVHPVRNNNNQEESLNGSTQEAATAISPISFGITRIGLDGENEFINLLNQ